MTQSNPGLCATCKHHRVVKGTNSDFWMCRRSALDARFPRYPRLPVLRCAGYEAAREANRPPPAPP